MSSRLALAALVLAVIACAFAGALLYFKGFDYLAAPPAAVGELSQRVADLEQQTAVREALSGQVEQLVADLSALQQRAADMEQAAAQLRTQTEQMQAQLQAESSARHQVLLQRLEQLEAERQADSRRIDAAREALEQLQAQWSGNQQRLRQRFSRLQARQTLQEVAAALRTGERQLQLAGNRNAALAAYDLALSALQSLDAGAIGLRARSLAGLREAIIAERAALQAATEPDIEAVIAELNGLAGAAANWPLIGADDDPETAGDAAAREPESWWQKFQASLGHLVRIRETATPRLTGDEAAHLRRHVQMQLKTATLLALQQRDDEFRNLLQDTRSFIETWFVSGNRGVAAALDRLRALDDAGLRPDWPATGQALSRVRELLAGLGNGTD